MTAAHLATHRVLHGGLLRGSCRAATASLEVFEDNVVGQHVDRKLLVAELVETGHLVTRRGADFVGDFLARCEHGNHGRLELGFCESEPLRETTLGRAKGETSGSRAVFCHAAATKRPLYLAPQQCVV